MVNRRHGRSSPASSTARATPGTHRLKTLAVLWLAASVCFGPNVGASGRSPNLTRGAAQSGTAPLVPVAALKQLHKQLSALEAGPEADLTAIISERALTAVARRMSGLEIELANGARLQVTTVELTLKTGAALVQVGVKAYPAGNLAGVDLRLSGSLGSGEASAGRLRLPFRLTEVTPGEQGSASVPLLQSLLRDWLSPERWNATLPPVELPLQLSETLELPAASFEVGGQMPMTVTTPAYRVKADFSLAAVMILDGRAVVALSLADGAISAPAAGNHAANNEGAAALEAEVARLAQRLTAAGDLRVRLSRRALNSVLAQIAAAGTTDLTAQLKPARIRSETIDGIFKTVNYTDVEAGDGRADVQKLAVERIKAGHLDLRLAAQGDLSTRLRGREYGIPYRLSPNGTFAIRDEVVPLQVANEHDRLTLRAAPSSRLPIEVKLGLSVAGRQISLTRNVVAQADQWLKGLTLPMMLARELPLPRRIKLDPGQPAQVSTALARCRLSRLRGTADQDAVEITAELLIDG